MSASSVVVCFRKLISACPSEAASSNGPSKSKPSTSSVTPRSRDRCTVHLTVGAYPSTKCHTVVFWRGIIKS